jgi:hypothetical protein
MTRANLLSQDDRDTGTKAMTATCNKCNGAGQINAFRHYAGGVCFDCKGSGQVVASATVTCFEPKADTSRTVKIDGWELVFNGYGCDIYRSGEQLAEARAVRETKGWEVNRRVPHTVLETLRKN